MIPFEKLVSGTLPHLKNNNPYTTDKLDHGYLPFYEGHLSFPVEKFMEIGIWKGDSIRMFRDHYEGKGQFHVLDRFWAGTGVVSEEVLRAEGFVVYRGEQDDVRFLSTIKDQFDVIVEDGSHLSDDQIITFKHLFRHNVKPGGFYILEDLRCCREAYWWQSVQGYENTFLAVCERVLAGGGYESQFFTKDESEYFMDHAEIILENCPYSPIAFIRKKNQ